MNCAENNLCNSFLKHYVKLIEQYKKINHDKFSFVRNARNE